MYLCVCAHWCRVGRSEVNVTVSSILSTFLGGGGAGLLTELKAY